MKYILPLLLLSLFTAIFGKISQADFDRASYADEPKAAAIILYESASNTFKVINNRIKLVKKVHRKIKVLDASRFDQASISVTYYHNNKASEKISKIEAYTHNGMSRVTLDPNDIYQVDRSENWSDKRFTFPSIQNGSILEYRYRIESPFFFNFGDWEFQNKYPTIYSEIRGDIPANYVYVRSLTGKKTLGVEISKLKKRCLEINGFESAADCDSFVYGMYNIPSFKEEPFMLSNDNYISKISFEFQQSTNFEGITNTFSKTWKDVDREFQYDKSVGKQLKSTSFFNDQLPANIVSTEDDLEKAKAIYSFIQRQMTWDGKYRIFSDVRAKNAFKEKIGNLAEINIALVNSLKAVGFDATIALGTLRNHKLISDVYPTLSDFNYIAGYVVINNKEYLLDASNANIPFGMIPFEALNERMRVMDFKKGSFWLSTVPKVRSMDYYKIENTINGESELTGNLKEIHSGYRALEYKNVLESHQLAKLHDNNLSEEIELFNASLKSTSHSEKPVEITHDFTYTPTAAGNSLYIYPLSLHFERLENPFQKESRNNPINFGYSRSSTYDYKLIIPEGYTIEEVPNNKMFKFLDNQGTCSFSYEKNNNEIKCLVRFTLNSHSFSQEDYGILKDFFQEISKEHKTAVLKLKKI